MAPPALQPRLTRPCPPALQVPCVRRALAGGASRAHSTSPQASPLGAPPPSSVPLSTRPFVLLGTHPHPVYPPRITRPAQLRPQGPAVAPARLAAAPSSWVRETGESLLGGWGAPRCVATRRHGCHEKPPRSASPAPASSLCSAQPAACTRCPRPASARARRWAQWAQGRPPPAQPRGQRPPAKARLGLPARAEVIALSCVPSEINRSEPFPTRPSGPHWCVPAPLLPARGAGVGRWCQALACGEGTLSARLISRL